MKTKKIVLLIIIIICLIGIVFSSYKIFTWKKDNDRVIEIKEEIYESIIITEDADEIKYSVDFASLKKKNSGTVAYLKVNNTNIDYVVVKSRDNSYYLKHNFEKKYSSSGWVFADYHNKFDGTDKNIVIYGHSMLNGSMFGTLKKTLNKKWYTNKNNLDITFITEDGEHIYRVFSVYQIKAENYYINTVFKSDNEFSKFVNTLKNRSIYNFKVNVDKNDQILTLSTCSSGASNRTVLHAKMIK